jgi:hypothetical protein
MTQFNDRLKSAVRSVDVPPYLEARIRNQVRTTPATSSWMLHLVPVGVAAGICVAVFTAYQLEHLRLTRESQEFYISSVSTRIASIMRVGLGDHIHCSIFRKYPKKAPTATELVEQIGPQYAGLVPIVRKHVPARYTMTLAHQCHYHNRAFIHLSLKDDSNMLSLVITKKNQGESFETEQLIPALVQSGIPMYQSGVQHFAMTAFETRDFLIYFISDLPPGTNSEMMTAMAPEVQEFFKKLES